MSGRTRYRKGRGRIMATQTGIQWTRHTLNPWWGCTKVHAGCAFCYAETLDARWAGKGNEHWDKNPRRMILGEWGQPAKWDAEAKAAGRIDEVFCASMCDLFEDYTGPVVDQQGKQIPMPGSRTTWDVPNLRRRVFEIIESTSNLLWQLLTKRPENVTGMVPPGWLDHWPSNVITGTSPCDQATANESVPHLLRIPGRRFLSCEPLLGTIDFSKVPDEWDRPSGHGSPTLLGDIDWVIIGCESDGKRTNRLPEGSPSGYWKAAGSIIAQCREAGVPVFHKQAPHQGQVSGNPSDWPEPTRIRQMPKQEPAR